MDNHKSFSENSISETRDLKFSKEEDNIEILVEVLNKFEQNSLKKKQIINSLEVSSFSSSQIPNTLQICYSNLQTSLNHFSQLEEQIDNFGGNYILNEINEFQKQIKTSTKQFGHIKAEFFIINEPVLNKDIIDLSINLIQNSNQKLDLIEQKIFQIQENMKNNSGQSEKLKYQFILFYKKISEQFKVDLQTLCETIDTQYSEILNSKDNLTKVLEIQKNNLKDFQKRQAIAGLDSAEQRQQVNQYHTKLINSERNLQRWNKSLEQSQPLEYKFRTQLSSNQDIQDGDIPQTLNEIQTKCQNFQQLVNLILDGRKLKESLSNLFIQLKQIQTEQDELTDAESDLNDKIQQKMQDETKALLEKINQMRNLMAKELQEKYKRTQAAEEKVKDIEISENDKNFILKELIRQTRNLDQIGSYIDILQEQAKPGQPISVDDLKQLRLINQEQEKLKSGKLDQACKGVESVEQFLLKSVKNKLNEENKVSQNSIAQIKKAYDEFIKKYEQVMLVYNGVVEEVNGFQEKYKMQLSDIMIQLQEEYLNICSKQEKDGKEVLLGKCLTFEKRNIIDQVNNLVLQFNEITKLLREYQGKPLKSEDMLNTLVLKNQSIQQQCRNIGNQIEEGKKEADKIIARLGKIFNQETIIKLQKMQTQQSALAEECRKLKAKIESDLQKNEQIMTKGSEQLDECLAKLELFNPLSNKSIEQEVGQQNVINQVADYLDETNNFKDEIQAVFLEINDFKDSLDKIDLHTILSEIKLSQGTQDFLTQLEQVHTELKNMYDTVQESEQKQNDLIIEINKLQKRVKDLVDLQINKIFKKAKQQLNDLENINGNHQDSLKHIQYKFKILFGQVCDHQANQGKKDPSLFQKLDAFSSKLKSIGDQVEDNELAIGLQRNKKNESLRTLDECKQKINTKFNFNIIDKLITDLRDQEQNNKQISDQLNYFNEQLLSKTKELTDLIENYDVKQELQEKNKQTDKELDEDFKSLRSLLDKLPQLSFQLKRTVAEMREGTQSSDEHGKQQNLETSISIIDILNQGGDYEEKKEELDEQFEELCEVQDVIVKFEENYKAFSEEYKELQQNLVKDQENLDKLKKYNDQIIETKNAISNLITDTLDTLEQLEDIKKDIGDCELPVIVTKRKNQVNQFFNRFERAKKDNFYMKKAFQQKPDQKTNSMTLSFNNQKQQEKLKAQIKSLEDRLKEIEIAKKQIESKYRQELEKIDQKDFDDFNKNFIIIHQLRELKQLLTDNELKTKEIEDMQKEILRKLTEQDLENSTDLLTNRANDLKERLIDAKKHLEKIYKSGQQMDGNTSNAEEEDFIMALNNEMPEVIKNINTNLFLLSEVDNIAKEVKISLDTELFKNLKQKVQIASENVEESEQLLLKLEKEIVEWNAQKKLIKRDMEIEEMQNLFADIQDDLQQEKTNTEVELERNREKQDENRDQEMVDKDGKKVDIMNDLIRLEAQMEAYIQDVDEILERLLQLEPSKDQVIEDFNQMVPEFVTEERKKRNKLSQASKMKQLKRPPQIWSKKDNETKPSLIVSHDMDLYVMIEINCQFRKPAKDLISQLKQLHSIRKDMEDKYASMRREVFKIKQIKLYKPIAGDHVDEMFAGYLNKAKLSIEVQRISAKNYMFGTKKILANIINGHLVIRVGGGFMNVEEFIDQYGKIEMLKLMKYEEKTKNEEKNKNEESPDSQRKEVNPTPKRNLQRGSSMFTGIDAKNELRKTLQTKIQRIQNQPPHGRAESVENYLKPRGSLCDSLSYRSNNQNKF